MRRSNAALLVLLGIMTPRAADAATPSAVAVSEQRALLDKYCAGCHNDRQKAGGLTLSGLDLQAPAAHAETLEKIVRKLRTKSMPPSGMPRPDAGTLNQFTAGLETALDDAAAKRPDPGRPAVHRLNRTEYTNAIRDLLSLEIDGAALLPPDTQGFGFDNIADVLSTSPGLLERYLIAAQKIARLAVGDTSIRPAIQTYTLPYLVLTQDDRMSDDLPAGSRGGVAVRHYFPVDGEYVIRLRLQKAYLATNPRGLRQPEAIDVRLDGVRLKVFNLGSAPPPVDLKRQRAAVAAAAAATSDLLPRAVRPTDKATQGVDSTEQSRERFAVPEDAPDAHLDVRFHAKAGLRVVGVSFQRRAWAAEGVGPSVMPAGSFAHASGNETDTGHGRIDMGIDAVMVEGPFESTRPDKTPSRDRIFVCRSETDACASRIIARLARGAFRRPVLQTELADVRRLYREARATAGFDAGIARAIEVLLTDPEFLFRVERDPRGVQAGAVYRLSDVELASRLSFFLWSSIPDETLIGLAERRELHRPGVLDAQVTRMLADPRAAALTSNFFGQWLYTRNMVAARPDPKANPAFDENLRAAFLRESELFVASQLRDDRSVLDLLRADYTFVNERLARHYGLPNIYGPHFRRVSLPDDRRAGILGQGSLLTVTSMSDRTSPVKRGAWILENLLGAPPPPPPANVPPLDSTPLVGTLRQRMEQHRKNPACAGCHARMDPLGFALENFDATGRWRDVDGGSPVDASGTLPDGTAFKTPATFRSALLQTSDAFVTTVTEKLLTYALGRGVEYYDKPAVRRIVRESAASDYRWSELILAVVKSAPFQMRRAQS
jgi:mono/diheme cytochrome c family protein